MVRWRCSVGSCGIWIVALVRNMVHPHEPVVRPHFFLAPSLGLGDFRSWSCVTGVRTTCEVSLRGHHFHPRWSQGMLVATAQEPAHALIICGREAIAPLRCSPPVLPEALPVALPQNTSASPVQLHITCAVRQRATTTTARGMDECADSPCPFGVAVRPSAAMVR